MTNTSDGETRRSSRSQHQPNYKEIEVDDQESIENDDVIDKSSIESEEDIENEETKQKQKYQTKLNFSAISKSNVRKSSRATKFSRSMKERDIESDAYYLTLDQANGHADQPKKKAKHSDTDSEANPSSGEEASDSESSPTKAPVRSSRRISNRNNHKDTSDTPTKAPNKGHKTKSPAASHSTRRRKIKTEIAVHSSEEDSESDEYSEASDSDDEEEEEALKIQRIIASRSETRKVWRTICKDMNTSEVDNGSRWFQEDTDPSQDDVYEERFLIKWADVGFLHCSWEFEDDLLSQVEGAKLYLNTFFRKSVNGLLYDIDERGDGEYFNPDYLVIDRILGIEYPEYDCVYNSKNETASKKKVLQSNEAEEGSSNNILGNENIAKFGILLDKKHPDYEERTGRQFLVKWSGLGYSESTYEFERDLILLDVEYLDHVDDFLKRRKKPTKNQMMNSYNIAEKQTRRLYKFFGEKAIISAEEKEQKVKEYQEKLLNIEFPNNGKLRDYQAEGVSWIISNHVNNRSSILADEMGLGKTLQTAVYINMLATTLCNRGPYLIIAPLSTIQHWQREFVSWTGLNTLIYHGLAADREYIREYEFAFEVDRPDQLALRQTYLSKVHPKKATKSSRTWMAQVVVTTPEIFATSDDFAELCAIPWEVVVVDEAHKLKNYNSKLSTYIRDQRFKFNRSLLLTGTPIQNNIGELWALMATVDPDKFSNSSSFLARYENMKDKESIDELHEIIRPYILRRLKEDVEKSVPPKEETIIEIELTVVQKQYYRALYEKNLQFLHKNKKKDFPSLSNLAMQLRKCCNHPFLLNGVEAELRNQEKTEFNEAEFLCKSSGKLVLLDKLLPRLRADGHRVLMFSQFRIMLDILEDYLKLRNMKFERIDGCITGHKRQMAIDRFQAKKQDGTEPFVMLLSTRAGGVGINLTAADTCIIYDSDWNPQNDLQAQARCHRIGQTKNVKIYRLLSRKSYEMQMFHMSSLKMGLDQAVLHGIESKDSSSGGNTMTKEEVEKLLRHGAYDIFQEEKDGSAEKESNEFLQSDIDTIMARRTKRIIHENTGSKSNVAGGTFSKAVFKATNAGEGDASAKDIDIDDPEFWKKMIGEPVKKVDHNNLTGKKRKRNITNYSEHFFDQIDDTQQKESKESEYDYSSDSDSVDSLEEVAERYHWGGKKPTEWNKFDADYLLNRLALYGLSRRDEIFNTLAKRQSWRYTAPETFRMCWSLIFSYILETVDAEVVENSKKAEQRAAKKKTEDFTEETKANEAGSTQDLASDKSHLEKCFRKTIEHHAEWLDEVFTVSNACVAPARDQSLIDHVLKKTKHCSALTSAFNDNIWPALQRRGWKTLLDETEDLMKTKYTFKGRTYNYVDDVLKASKTLHPELKNVITVVQGSKKAEIIDKAAPQSDISAKLYIGNVSYQTMQSCLQKFGCLQVFYDMNSKRPHLNFPKKFLTNMLFMYKTNKILSLARSMSQSPNSNSKNLDLENSTLQKILQVSSKAPLPHPQWKGWHDAVLIRAIGKHGWIDRSNNYKAIVDDTSIEWGHPFDDKDIRYKTESNNTSQNDESSILQEIASRAAEFLNEFSGRVDDIKGFNKKMVVSTYHLRKEQASDGSDECNVRWIVDRPENTSEPSLTIENTSADQSDEDAIFPSRTDLLKRAKFLLTNSTGNKFVGNLNTISNEGKQVTPSNALLNQGDPSNLFLAELLRILVKIPGKGNDEFAQRIFEITLKEVSELYRISLTKKDPDKLEKTERDNLELIIKYLRVLKSSSNVTSRQGKNAYRIILGLEPTKTSTGSGGNMLPIASQSTFESKKSIPIASQSTFEPKKSTPIAPVVEKKLDAPTNTTNKNDNSSTGGNSKQPLKLRDSALGDIAISKALEFYLQRSKKTGTTQLLSEAERMSHLKLTSFDTLLISVIISQGLPVWSENWKELIYTSGVPHVQESNTIEKGKEFKITWIGMGQVIEKAAQEWKRIAFEELAKVGEKMKSAPNSHLFKVYSDKHEVLKHDAKTKEEAYNQASMVARDPLLLAKKVIMLLEALRLRMGPIEFYGGGNQKKLRLSITCDNGLGPRVMNWLSKELNLWAKSLDIINPDTKLPLSFPVLNEPDTKHDVRIVALLDKNGCRNIFGQVAQQSRLRSICIINGFSGLLNLVPKVVKTLKNTYDVWQGSPLWWDQGEPHSDNDLNLICGILNFGYSGFEIMVQHYPNFKKNSRGIVNDFSRYIVQSRVNQLTRELSVLEDSASVARLLDERAKRNAAGSKRSSTASAGTNSIQTGLGAFFTSPRTSKKPDSPISIHSDGDSPVKVKTSPAPVQNQIGSNVIDLCEVADDMPSTEKLV